MTGPLAQMFAMLSQRRRDPNRLVDQPGLQPVNEYTNRPPMPFREPMQDTGPMPPMNPRITEMLTQMQSPAFGSPMVRGNIDVMNRPHAINPNGDISTVRSMSTNIDGREVLMPTVSEDARIMSDEEAIQQYLRTGRHLGIFDTPESATAYAGRLHDQQQSLGDMRALSSGDMGPEARRALRLTSKQPGSDILSTLMGK